MALAVPLSIAAGLSGRALVGRIDVDAFMVN
jgi:hypothetical protein